MNEDYTQNEDSGSADLIMIVGHNPGSCAPRMMTTLQEQKRAGGKIIAVNPLPEAGLMNFVQPNPQHYPNPLMFPIDVLGNRPTPHLYLPVRIGGDMAFLKGLMKILLDLDSAAFRTLGKRFHGRQRTVRHDRKHDAQRAAVERRVRTGERRFTQRNVDRLRLAEATLKENTTADWRSMREDDVRDSRFDFPRRQRLRRLQS